MWEDATGFISSHLQFLFDFLKEGLQIAPLCNFSRPANSQPLLGVRFWDNLSVKMMLVEPHYVIMNVIDYLMGNAA